MNVLIQEFRGLVKDLIKEFGGLAKVSSTEGHGLVNDLIQE